MLKLTYYFFGLLFIFSCMPEEPPITEEPDPTEENNYFPPITGSDWATLSPDSLEWKTENLDALYDYLEDNGTRAFLILKDGKMVVEKYWGKNILNSGNFDQNESWYWASAGKTLTAFLVGIAQQENMLSIEDKTSDYLGESWTSMDKEKQDLITIKHQLSMTTGLDFQAAASGCLEPSCLKYRVDAGDEWYYNNAPYTLLKDVITSASGLEYNTFTQEKLGFKIGMDGQWIFDGSTNVYWSTARDMARYGLLVLNNGNWADDQIMTDSVYFQSMINTSQSINKSYGYLWWLNGKNSIIYPGVTFALPVNFAPNSPLDMFSGAGKNGQFLDVIPSENMLVIRMGEAPNGAVVPIEFHNEMWNKLNEVMNK